MMINSRLRISAAVINRSFSMKRVASPWYEETISAVARRMMATTASQTRRSQKVKGNCTFLSLDDLVVGFDGFAVCGEAGLFDDDGFACSPG